MIRTTSAVRGVTRAVAVLAATAVAVLAPMSAPPITAATTGPATAAEPFEVLQLNLCNGGFHDCFTGGERSVTSAVAQINQHQPAVVTVNEVCGSDLTRLARETHYTPQFLAEGDATTGAPVACTGGRGDYGVAVLAHPDQGAVAGQVLRRTYRAQDGHAGRKVLLCAPYSQFTACATHLAQHEVAAQQCGELIGTVLPFDRPALVGGDLNLVPGGRPDARACVPQGWLRSDDGGVQHVMADDAAFDLVHTRTLPVDGTVFPGLLVELRR